MGRTEAIIAFIDEFLLAVIAIAVIAVIVVGFGIELNLVSIAAFSVLIGLILYIAYLAAKSQLGKPYIDKDRLLGKTGVVVEDLNPIGVVKVNGELWSAQDLRGKPISRGDRVIVRKIEGLMLYVEKIEGDDKHIQEHG